MRYYNTRRFALHTPYVTPVLRKSCRRIARLNDKPPSPEAKKRKGWLDYYSSHNNNISLTCRYFGITRVTFYKWLQRYDQDDTTTLNDRSRAPMNRRKRKIDPEIERRIIELRKKYIRYGKEKLAIIYKKTYGQKISSWQIQRTVKDRQLYYHPINNAKLAKRRSLGRKKKRITQLERTQKNGFFFQIDTKRIFWNGIKRYIYTAVEKDYKFAYAWMYKGITSLNASEFLARLHFLVSVKIELLQTDNGSEFAKYFERACKVLKIEHYFSRTRTPEDNETVERFHRTLNEEFLQLGNFTPFPEVFNPNLAKWLEEYNFNRPHQTLKYLSPVEFLEKNKKVYTKWPSSTVA